MHQVTVDRDGRPFLWVREDDDADCEIRGPPGAASRMGPVDGTYAARTRSASGAWVADGRFDAGSGQLR